MREKNETNLVLLAGKVSELTRPPHRVFGVVRRRRAEEPEPAVDEHTRVLARRAKVDELDLARARVPEEVAEVRVGLHRAELEELAETELDDSPRDLPQHSSLALLFL
jgi:hypothetical protein